MPNIAKAFDAGIAAFNAGRYAEALAVFRRAPGPQALFFAAHCQAALGRADEALELLEKLLRAAPKASSGPRALFARLMRARVVAEKDAGRLETAQRLLARARKIDPSADWIGFESAEIWRKLALDAEAKDRAEEAARGWESLARLEGHRAEARARLMSLWLGVLDAALEKESWPEAEKALDVALRRGSWTRDARARLRGILDKRAAGLERTPALRRARARVDRREPGAAKALVQELCAASARAKAAPERRSLVAGEALPPADRPRALAYDLQLPLRMAEVLAQQGRADQAADVWDGVLKEASARASLEDLLECFKICVSLKRYEDAFAFGERIIDADRGLRTMQILGHPWSNLATYQLDRAKAFARDAEVLRDLAARGRGSPWTAYYLIPVGGGTADGLAAALDAAPAERFAWMRQDLGRRLIRERRFLEATRAFELAFASSKPKDWRALAFAAEAFLCLGRPREAFKAFGAARKTAALHADQGDSLAWEGELRLWAGQYRRALEVLDRAVELEAPFAFCWRGAAKHLLGRSREGLADLEEGLRHFPRDAEAYVWRAEIQRALGKRELALESLAVAESKLAQDSEEESRLWVHALRGLLRADAGDAAGLDTAFAKLPPDVAGFLTSREKDRRRALALALRLGRGCRRPEHYTQALWVRVRP